MKQRFLDLYEIIDHRIKNSLPVEPNMMKEFNSLKNSVNTSENNNMDVWDATLNMIRKAIPKLAKSIEKGQVIPLNSKHLTRILHSNGINMR